MAQPLVRNGHILPNEEQPTYYLLAYLDSLLDQAAQRVAGGVESKNVNVYLNISRDIVKILTDRDSYIRENDGGYK